MQRIRTILQLLLKDERSSMRGRMAMLASVLILATVVVGLLLMPLGDQIRRNQDRRVLMAQGASVSGELR
jgi:hypothetical protein